MKSEFPRETILCIVQHEIILIMPCYFFVCRRCKVCKFRSLHRIGTCRIRSRRHRTLATARELKLITLIAHQITKNQSQCQLPPASGPSAVSTALPPSLSVPSVLTVSAPASPTPRASRAGRPLPTTR